MCKKFLVLLLSAVLIMTSTIGVWADDNELDMDMGGIFEEGAINVTVLENENGVKGGYITTDGCNYTAVCYNGSTFNGWYDEEGKLITTNLTVTTDESGEYYAASFKTENLINDSGFENYTSGSKIYDHTNTEKQIWTAHKGSTVASLTGTWGSFYASDSYKKSGNISSKMTPPWQLVTTDIKLQPNTEYYVSMNYLYKTQHPETYMDLTFGLYAPDSKGVDMVAAGSTTISNINEQGTWYKKGFLYTTGDTVPENVTFGYIFQVYNENESVSASVENSTDLYIDDIVVAPAEKINITLDATNVATIEPQNGCNYGFAIKGETYDFKVYSEPGTEPVVSVEGKELIADENGVYSFTPTIDTVISIDCGGTDEGRPAANKDYFGRDLSKYNKDVYLENVWEGDTVYQESALFITGKETVKLLYPVDEVISLRSYSLETAYIKGVDFDITEDGLIKILEGSRIPVYNRPLTTNTKPEENVFPLRTEEETWLVGTADNIYATYAISVTYKHSKTFDDGYQPITPDFQNGALNNTISKLKNGEKVNIVIYGDSISCGWSSSGLNKVDIYDTTNTEGNFKNNSLNVAPYAPPFYEMILSKLDELYPGQINFKNIALGGQSSPWGASNINARLALWKDAEGNQIVPDLIMVGFGVNDCASNVSTENFKANMEAIVDNARAFTGNAEMEALYYSPFLPNQLTATWDVNQMLAYENALDELATADENIGLIKITSIFAEIIKSKAPEDYISSYWNHGNDFTARVYATSILEAFLGEEDDTHTPGDINDDGKINLNDLVVLAQYVAKWENLDVNLAALDTNGDGEVSLLDVTNFARYLAGWSDAKIY